MRVFVAVGFQEDYNSQYNGFQADLVEQLSCGDQSPISDLAYQASRVM